MIRYKMSLTSIVTTSSSSSPVAITETVRSFSKIVSTGKKVPIHTLRPLLSRYTRCLKVANSTTTSILATIGTLRYEKAERNFENQSQGCDTRVSLNRSAPLLNNMGVGKMSRGRTCHWRWTGQSRAVFERQHLTGSFYFYHSFSVIVAQPLSFTNPAVSCKVRRNWNGVFR